MFSDLSSSLFFYSDTGKKLFLLLFEKLNRYGVKAITELIKFKTIKYVSGEGSVLITWSRYSRYNRFSVVSKKMDLQFLFGKETCNQFMAVHKIK